MFKPVLSFRECCFAAALSLLHLLFLSMEVSSTVCVQASVVFQTVLLCCSTVTSALTVFEYGSEQYCVCSGQCCLSDSAALLQHCHFCTFCF